MDIVNVAKGIGGASSTSEIEFSGRDLLAQFKNLEDVWKKAEALLAKSHVPCEVSVKVRSGTLGSESEPEGVVTTYLAYCKVKNQWRIAVVEETEIFNCPPDFEGRSEESKPVTECPVDVRLEMLEWFDKLYTEVVKTTDRYVPKINGAVKKFEKVLASLDK